MGGFHARIIAAGSRLGRSYLAEQGNVGRREAGAVSRTRPIQPVRLCGPPGTIYTDFPGTGPDNRPSGHLRRGGTTRIAESISAARRNVSGGMTATSRSEEHTSELQSLMRISYAVFCLKQKT